MSIRRFHAPTAREALAMARDAFGDSALILSNRQLAQGVEVMAASEDALAQLGSAAPPVSVPVQPDPAAARGSTVQADTEQLAMSTLSFQDYVRERMLRRQHEARRSEPALPPSSQAAPTPAPAPAPAPLRAPPAAAAGAPANQSAGELMQELQAMRQLMEERFNTLAWIGHARQDLVHSNLMLTLVRAGFSPALSRAVLQPLDASLSPAAAVRAVLETLERMLDIDRQAPALHEERGALALLGATGVGKTTGVAKLAALCARAHGAASVGLITLDTHRAGAHEQLRAHGRGLGIVAHLAHDRTALQELLSLLGGKRLILIDTAGVAPRDAGLKDMLGLLDLPSVRRVMVLNAGAHGDTQDEIASAFKAGGCGEAIVSKVDESARLGPVIDTVIRHRLKLRGVSCGQRVPDDWNAADAGELVRASMRSNRRSAFEPRSADLGFFYAPDQCASSPAP